MTSATADYVLEFDRPGIYRFRRWLGLEIGLWGSGPFFAFLGLVFAMPDRNNGIVYHSFESLLLGLLKGAGIGYVLGLGLTILIIVLTVGRTATRYANQLSATVKGPYLNIVEHGESFSDRKIHFNQLMDYSVFQNSAMRRAGIYSIRITLNTTYKNNGRCELLLPGVIDAFAVRDKLIALDTEREKME